jgi:uncharacterized protein YcfL
MKTKLIVITALASLFAVGCKSNSERNWDDARDAAEKAGEAATSSAAEAAKDAAGEVRDKVVK